MATRKDYYSILGVTPSASPEDIKEAYRGLAQQYHPDKHQDNPLEDLAEDKLKDINEAYEVLRDPERRESYDSGQVLATRSQHKGKKEERDPLVSAVKDMMTKGKDRETIARELSTKPPVEEGMEAGGGVEGVGSGKGVEGVEVGGGVEGEESAQPQAMFPDYDTALNAVSPVYDKLIDDARKEIVTGAELGWGWVGGAVGAIVGAIVWSVVMVVAEREVGILALGLGLLCGYAVHAAASMKRSSALQAAAVITSTVSIAIGKYFAFWWLVRQSVAEEYGQEVAEQVRLFSIDTVRLLAQNANVIFGPYDVLWVILAVSIAWRVPRPAGLLRSFSELPEIQALC